MILRDLRRRGLAKIGLIVADGLTGLEEAAGRAFPRSDFQRCVTHVKRRMLARVRAEDKPDWPMTCDKFLQQTDPTMTRIRVGIVGKSCVRNGGGSTGALTDSPGILSTGPALRI